MGRSQTPCTEILPGRAGVVYDELHILKLAFDIYGAGLVGPRIRGALRALRGEIGDVALAFGPWPRLCALASEPDFGTWVPGN